MGNQAMPDMLLASPQMPAETGTILSHNEQDYRMKAQSKASGIASTPPTVGAPNQCLQCFWYSAGKCVADKGAYCKILRDRV